jgi:hypothetical protein
MLSVSIGLGVNRIDFIHQMPPDARLWDSLRFVWLLNYVWACEGYAVAIQGPVTSLLFKLPRSKRCQQREREKHNVAFQREHERQRETDLAVSIRSTTFLLSVQFQTHCYLIWSSETVPLVSITQLQNPQTHLRGGIHGGGRGTWVRLQSNRCHSL